MVEVAIHYPHLSINAEEKAIIKGANLKVSELITFHLAYGWGAEELFLHFPYLSSVGECIKDIELVAKVGNLENLQNTVTFLGRLQKESNFQRL
ncbi:hypothetical protein SAMN04488541_10177 [Thermoflexibacter ruber]|uniref:DUF433 domain-containing protein n=2 Tax=Thermoflexibacter ruber TaxID=1003 RepID=A0A1I2G8L4_9BACT|nr:hypothetical protein SAMN04488541_10177 [Thermoflexibacter ruber]